MRDNTQSGSHTIKNWVDHRCRRGLRCSPCISYKLASSWRSKRLGPSNECRGFLLCPWTADLLCPRRCSVRIRKWTRKSPKYLIHRLALRYPPLMPQLALRSSTVLSGTCVHARTFFLAPALRGYYLVKFGHPFGASIDALRLC